MTSADWFLFGYITLVALYHVYQWWLSIKAPFDQIHPDERGVIGEAHDSQGNDYYIIAVPKEHFDNTWAILEKEFEEE